MFIYSHVKCENFRNMVNQYIFGYITAIYSLNFHHIPSTLGMKKHLHIIFSNLNSLLFNNLSILLKMYLEGHVMVTNATFSIYVYTKSGFQFPWLHFLTFKMYSTVTLNTLWLSGLIFLKCLNYEIMWKNNFEICNQSSWNSVKIRNLENCLREFQTFMLCIL